MPAAIVESSGGCACTSAICAKVVDACGADVAGFVVSAGDSSAETGDDGSACVSGLAPGEYVVTAVRGSCSASVAAVPAGTGAPAVEIPVDCGGTVKLRVNVTAVCSESGASGTTVAVSDGDAFSVSASTGTGNHVEVDVPRNREYTVTASRSGCESGEAVVAVACADVAVGVVVACGDLTGQLCVTLSPACSTPSTAFSVTVRGEAGVVATATIVTPGTHCFSLVAGDYAVTASAPGCSSFSFARVSVGCGGSVELNAWVACGTDKVTVIRVFGCYGAPVPGAVVRVTPPPGGSPIPPMVTDEAGEAAFVATVVGAGANPYGVVVEPPGPRLLGSTFSLSGSACSGLYVPDVLLAPAPGYACCEIQKSVTPTWPFPIKTTLLLTDAGGVESVPLVGKAVGGVAWCEVAKCVSREMGEVAENPTHSVWCWLAGHGGIDFGIDEAAIGTGTTAVRYAFSFTNTGASGSQTLPAAGSKAGGYGYNTNAPDLPCPDNEDRLMRAWRLPRACDAAPTAVVFAYSAAGVVNSWNPFNVTFTFTTPRGAFGARVGDMGGASPFAYLDGQPYSPTVVISED